MTSTLWLNILVGARSLFFSRHLEIQHPKEYGKCKNNASKKTLENNVDVTALIIILS